MQYFYHSSIKNYTIALLDMFSDIHVPRFNEYGEKIEDIKVPIQFGNKDKAYTLSKLDYENLHNGNVNILPRMALGFDSLAKAPDRDTNKNVKINRRKLNNDADSLIYEYQHNAVAYDFYFTIFIATRTASDAFIMIEQIAPLFRPDITIKIQELDIQEEPTSVPVMLQDFAVTLPEAMEEDEIRVIEVEFPVVVKGQLYLPIKEESVIKELNVNVAIIEQQRNDAAIKYGVDTTGESVAPVSSFDTAVAPENYPDEDTTIPEAIDSAVTVETRYDNNLPEGP